MKDFFSYYEILDVAENANSGAIKSAYRSKALKYHPDRVPEHLKKKSEEIFKQIQEAYDVLSDSGKRKKYDEGLKNAKGGQPPGQGSPGDPLIRVDRNYFKFENVLPSAYVSDLLVIFNEGGGTLTGAITADKPWVTVSDTSINISDYQEITITADALSLKPGFRDSALIEIRTNGGDESVTVDISVDSSPLTLFIFYVKPVAETIWARALAVILSVFILILFAVHSCNRTPVYYQPEGTTAEPFSPRYNIPKLEDFRGEWYGYLSSYKCAVLSLIPKENHLEGRIVIGGVIGKIKGEVRESGDVVFKIESYEDVFKDLIGRTVNFLKYLSLPFVGRLKQGVIEISSPESITFSRINDQSSTCLMNSLVFICEGSDKFQPISAVYDVEFETAWEAALKVLQSQKEKIRYENKEERIIITYITEHSSLLGNYAHKYVVLFNVEEKTTEVIAMQFRYEKGLIQPGFSPASNPIYTTDVYFFIPLEKEIGNTTGKSDFVIRRLYDRKSFLSKKIDRLISGCSWVLY